MGDELERAAQAAAAAPLSEDGWTRALEAATRAIGGWGAQLVGADATGAVCLNLASGVPDEVLDGFLRHGGGDPARNPRAAAMFAAPVGLAVGDEAFIDAGARARHAMYQDFYEPNDAPWSCLVKLAAMDGVAALAVLRGRVHGPVTPQQARVAEALAPVFRNSLRLRAALGAEAARLAVGALDDVGSPALVCDGSGRLVRASPGGEAELRRGDVLAMRAGRVRAVVAEDDARLQAAAARAARGPGPCPSQPVLLRAADGGTPVRAEVARLEAARDVIGRPLVLVVLTARVRRVGPELFAALGLTAAESEVAVRLVRGESPAEIAESRSVAESTVRAQMRALFSKLNVRRQGELTALLGRLV